MKKKNKFIKLAASAALVGIGVYIIAKKKGEKCADAEDSKRADETNNAAANTEESVKDSCNEAAQEVDADKNDEKYVEEALAEEVVEQNTEKDDSDDLPYDDIIDSFFEENYSAPTKPTECSQESEQPAKSSSEQKTGNRSSKKKKREVYYINPSSKKYHQTWCRYCEVGSPTWLQMEEISSTKNDFQILDDRTMIFEGKKFTPCKYCMPQNKI